MRRTTLPLAAAAMALAFTGSAEANLISNGDFESAGSGGNPFGWSNTGGATPSYITDGSVTHGGNGSVALADPQGASDRWFTTNNAFFDLQPSTMYRLSVMGKDAGFRRQ